MKYQITVNGPTGLELENEWADGEDAADEQESAFIAKYRGQLVAISVHSEQEIEDGPSE